MLNWSNRLRVSNYYLEIFMFVLGFFRVNVVHSSLEVWIEMLWLAQ